MKKFLAIFLCVAMMLSMASFAHAELTDGTFTGFGAGMIGKINVTVTVEGGKITQIEVGEHSETAGISDPAIKEIPQKIMDAQSTKVDVVAGATFTSNGIMEAVDVALNGPKEVAEIPDTADIIVIGAGMAGMTTAARAAQLGLNVVVFEQTAAVGGTAMVAGGTLLGNNTRMQKEAGIEDNEELAFADFVRLGGAGNFNEEIAREFVRISGPAVDWLDDLGCDFGDRVPYRGVYQPLNVERNYSGKGGASAFIKALNEEFTQYVGKNAFLSLNTKVENLLVENNVVVGVKATMPDGTQRDFRAPATAICTGGYGGSEELLNLYNFENVLTTAPAFVTGDGYKWLAQLDAAFTNMDFCTSYAGGIRTSDNFSDFSYFNVTNGALWINLQGQRMANETGADNQVKSDSWRLADQNIVFNVFSKEMLIPDAKVFSNGPWGSVKQDFDTFSEMLIEQGNAFKADSIDELAEKMGVPVADFAATIAAYNVGCETNNDVFGRTKQLIKMENGPFYAVKTIPYVMITSGGPMMNANCEVIRLDGTPIKGAYIAGEIVGMANTGGHNSIGGMGHGNCLAWGKKIAEIVADQLKK